MRICVIGAVGHTAQAINEMKAHPEAQFVGIAPGDSHEDAAALARFAIPVYTSYQTMLDELHPDVAIVSPVFGLTGKIIIECANRHIDVFAEKPVAATVEELEAVEKAVKESGIRFSAMHFLRFTPSFYCAREMVKAGAIGNVRMLNAQKSYRFGTRPDWYRERDVYVGTIPWVGIHAIDWIYYFSGKKFKTVTAHHVGSPEMTALGLYEMEDGVISAINVDYLRPAKAPTHGDDRIRVAGDKGVIEVFADRFVLINENGSQEFTDFKAPKLAYEFLTGSDELTADEIFMITKVALLTRDAADKNVLLTID